MDDANGHKKMVVSLSMMHSVFKLLVNSKHEFEKGLTEEQKQDGVKFDSTPYLSS